MVHTHFAVWLPHPLGMYNIFQAVPFSRHMKCVLGVRVCVMLCKHGVSLSSRCGSQGVACRDMRCFVCFASHTSHGGVWGGFGCQSILGCLHSAACDAAKPSWLGLSSTLVLLAGTRLFPSQRYILFCMSVVRLSQRQKHQ